ncbi:MAG: 2-dehydropantoate 2-reductase [Candidatus Latescibacterota bacterium]|nr:MAG: 2-dehydropantoate 2-reductase [Candidatus Latescibacterota bacterium]
MSRPVYVFGAGALGSLLGALLSRAAPVELLARPDHAAAIRRQGGVRVSMTRPGIYPVQVRESVGTLPEAALVLMTVKAFDLESALQALAPRLDASHLVVVLQNGLGIRSLAERVLGRSVVRAVTFMAASQEAPGRVAFNAAGKTYLPANGEVLELWRRSDMPAVQVDDIETYVWRKLAINAVINPLSALLHVTNGELAPLQRVAERLVQELAEVARREGQSLEARETVAKVLSSMQQTSLNCSSMLQDVRAGRRTEIDWINGAIVRLAQKHALAVPAHTQLLDLVRFVERNVRSHARGSRVLS